MVRMLSLLTTFLVIQSVHADELYGPIYIAPEVVNYCMSPHQVTCQAPWFTKDPTGTLGSDVDGEVRAFRILRSVIRSHPNWTSVEVEKELVRRIYNEKRVEKIKQAFDLSKRFIKEVLQTQPLGTFSENELKMLVERLDLLILELPIPASLYKDSADLFTKNQIYYQRTGAGVTKIRVGGAFLINSSSLFNLVFSTAHEVAHAIDPCEMEHIHMVPKAYEQVMTCFQENAWVPPVKLECGRNDRVSEVFADWIAAQATGLFMREAIVDYEPVQKIAAATNATRDLCAQGLVGEKSSYRLHQTPSTRIEEIFAGQPFVRSALGCPNLKKTIPTCSFTKMYETDSKGMTWNE